MIDQKYYKPIYKTAEGRALYLVAMKSFGGQEGLGEELGCTRQCIDFWCKRGLPIKYAGYIGRKVGIDPMILNYTDAILFSTFENNSCNLEYAELVDCGYFNKEDLEYIFRGDYIKDYRKYLRMQDKEIGK